jgi:hypothetical protein
LTGLLAPLLAGGLLGGKAELLRNGIPEFRGAVVFPPAE